MKQIGIIYKFTIVAKYKFDEHRPFYVGQHWEKGGLKHFLSSSVSNYPGSGTIWEELYLLLKRKFPTCWRKLIKREILFYSENCSQKALDRMEEYFIKHEKSHYSYKKGGCNVLWGTANGFGSGSPMKDPMVRKKISKSRKGKWIGEEHFMYGKHWDENTKKRNAQSNKGKQAGHKHWNYGNHWSEEVRNKIGNGNRGKRVWLGKHHTEETKQKLSEHFKGKKWKDESRIKMSESVSGKGNPMFGKVRINNGKVNMMINRGEALPAGFILGMLRYGKNKNKNNK